MTMISRMRTDENDKPTGSMFLMCSAECAKAMDLRLGVINMYKNMGRWLPIDNEKPSEGQQG